MKNFSRDPPYVIVAETWANIKTHRVILDGISDIMELITKTGKFGDIRTVYSTTIICYGVKYFS